MLPLWRLNNVAYLNILIHYYRSLSCIWGCLMLTQTLFLLFQFKMMKNCTSLDSILPYYWSIAHSDFVLSYIEFILVLEINSSFHFCTQCLHISCTYQRNQFLIVQIYLLTVVILHIFSTTKLHINIYFFRFILWVAQWLAVAAVGRSSVPKISIGIQYL